MAPGCAGRGAAIADSGTASDGPAALDAVPDRSVSELDLTWRGRPAGRAREELWARGGASGFRFARRERWRVMRGGALVEWETEVVIDADRELRGEKVTLYRDRVLAGSARRSRSGWVIEASASGGARLAPARAEPAELVLVRLALSGASSWAGPVLLAGFDFAVAELAVEPDGSARRIVLSGPAGVQETRVWLGRGGTTERAGAAGRRPTSSSSARSVSAAGRPGAPHAARTKLLSTSSSRPRRPAATGPLLASDSPGSASGPAHPAGGSSSASRRPRPTKVSGLRSSSPIRRPAIL